MDVRFARASAERTLPTPHLTDAERRLVEDLRAAGADVRTVWELAAATWYPSTVVDVLIEHLARVDDPYVVRGIAGALTVPCAGKRAYVALIAKLIAVCRSGSLSDLKLAYALGTGIARQARLHDLDELLTYIRDPAFGPARIPLLNRVASWNMPSTGAALMPLLADAELRPTVIRALGRLRVRAALPCIETLLSATDAGERAAAQRALRDFRRA
jgi:hypothetical protein